MDNPMHSIAHRCSMTLYAYLFETMQRYPLFFGLFFFHLEGDRFLCATRVASNENNLFHRAASWNIPSRIPSIVPFDGYVGTSKCSYETTNWNDATLHFADVAFVYGFVILVYTRRFDITRNIRTMTMWTFLFVTLLWLIEDTMIGT